MISRTTPEFWECFDVLPGVVQRQAERAYGVWLDNPHHPGLQFKCLDRTEGVYSVRVGLHWRALALRDGDTCTWFWIGSHAEYDRLIG